jgi:nucleotide-binding universal stress UspA family protein
VTDASDNGAVLFAYDGSEQAKAAIREASRQLGTRRRAVVLTVWEPLALAPSELDAASEGHASHVAREGAELARAFGFDARPLAVSGEPVWRAIVDAAHAQDAGTVVLGRRGRSGIARALMGSVATAVAQHARRAVLIVAAPS